MLAAAEQLFAEKGYGPVTLRQIGARAGLNHSSLYHHVPGGKADLFVEVMERIYARHRTGLSAALAAAEPEVRAQCYAAARWLLGQPQMDLVRLEHIDMPELAPAQVHQLANGAYTALPLPLVQALSAAHQLGEIAEHDFDLIRGGAPPAGGLPPAAQPLPAQDPPGGHVRHARVSRPVPASTRRSTISNQEDSMSQKLLPAGWTVRERTTRRYLLPSLV